MIAITRKFLVLFALTAVAAGLSACAEEEQNRVLSYQKGTYLGKTDQQLSADQLRTLINRAKAHNPVVRWAGINPDTATNHVEDHKQANDA